MVQVQTKYSVYLEESMAQNILKSIHFYIHLLERSMIGWIKDIQLNVSG